MDEHSCPLIFSSCEYALCCMAAWQAGGGGVLFNEGITLCASRIKTSRRAQDVWAATPWDCLHAWCVSIRTIYTARCSQTSSLASHFCHVWTNDFLFCSVFCFYCKWFVATVKKINVKCTSTVGIGFSSSSKLLEHMKGRPICATPTLL